MRYRDLTLAVAFSIGLLSSPAIAQEPFKAGGHWVAEKGKFIFFSKETVSVPDELQIDVEIDDTDHPVLYITMTETYEPGASAGYHVEKRIVEKKTFNVVGAVSYAGDRIVWGDVEDTTVWNCNVETPERLECLAIEPGDFAVSGAIILTRKQ